MSQEEYCRKQLRRDNREAVLLGILLGVLCILALIALLLTPIVE